MKIPRLYVIADMGVLVARGVRLDSFAEELTAAGVGLVQLRFKGGQPQQVLRAAGEVRRALGGADCRFILNDRADLAVLAGWDGVHLGQADLSPEDGRAVVGASRWVGVSTHTDEQVALAAASCADYLAIGPVFSTGTKLDAAPVVGLDGVRRARALTDKPLVAIGGMTRQNALSVMEAGADAVAVISGLFAAGETPGKVARDFLEILG